MPTNFARIARQKENPALVRLHRHLGRLNSVLTVMNTGAHPDDEQSGLMAFFRYALGMRIVIACSTRGESGQNALGPERMGALGVLRTREMEEAARELDADIAWLGHGPDDPVFDFGFSKDGDATLARWGEDCIVERLVRAYRSERPDIVIPTFLDVPGQHGHHRAMTRAAEKALVLAADPTAYPEHFDDGLLPWQVAKYYLPAWSGGGDTYDDEVPPPETTVRVETPGRDLATGAAYDQIGEWSRRFHASQGMGVWKDNPKTCWPLHLLWAPAGTGRETSVCDGLPVTLGDLAQSGKFPALTADALLAAQAAIEQAQAGFPHARAIIESLQQVAGHLEQVRSICPRDLLVLHGHRFEQMLGNIDRALIEASGLAFRAFVEPSVLSPGMQGELHLHVADRGLADNINAVPQLQAGISYERMTGENGCSIAFRLHIAPDAPLSAQYPANFSILGGNDPVFLELHAEIGGRHVKIPVDLETPTSIEPVCSVEMEPETIIARVQGPEREWNVSAYLSKQDAALALDAPTGWQIVDAGTRFALKAPARLLPGLHHIQAATRHGPAFRKTPIRYDHIGETAFIAPESLRILALDLELPENARIGYVGGGADRVGLWLRRMGFDVTELEEADLNSDLSRFTTIVVGIFAFGLRPDLRAAVKRLHDFVADGGHLLTLYHRPSDGWNPSTVPPLHLEIGSPSLRWRVTNPAAPVTILRPEHPLLNGPNKICEQDWDGWDKERGLYFSAARDRAYEPLLAMHDAGEKPLDGALVSARIGKGRHTHTSLVLHHQMDKLVPGGFRLMANLVQPA